MGQMVEFPRSDGKTTHGYGGHPPDGGKRGGVVVLHEYWGLRDEMKRLVDRLVGEGYHALAPDLFHGKVTHDAAEAGGLMQSLDWNGAVADVEAAVAKLKKEGASRVAVMGFCMGGALAVSSGLLVRSVDAVVTFYGLPHNADPGKLKVPVLAHFAMHDEWVTPARAEDFQRRTGEAGVSHVEVYNYDAKHAFMNDARPEVYNEAAATEAWGSTMSFLRTVFDESYPPRQD